MKHKIVDDVNVNLEFDKEDVEYVIDKITESTIKIVAVITIAQIIKKVVK